MDATKTMQDPAELRNLTGVRSVSQRTERANLFGETQALLRLWFAGGETCLWADGLQRALNAPALSPVQQRFLLDGLRAEPDLPAAPEEALLHAAAPGPLTVLAAPPALLALSCVENGAELLEKAVSPRLAWAEYKPGLQAQAALAATAESKASQPWGVMLPHRGVLLHAANADEACRRLNELEKAAQAYLTARGAWDLPAAPELPALDLPAAAELRLRLSKEAGRPLVVRRERALPNPARRLLADGLALAVEENGSSYFAGPDVAAVGNAAALQAVEAAAAVRAARLGQPNWLELAPASLPTASGVLQGEVALVTGAASGIGKACAESFLARGAAVVGLDVNPSVVSTFSGACYLGIACDLTDEDAVRAALRQTVEAFGGLDMVVLNAGIFPAGVRIESLQMADWDKVMRINLDANLTLLRESYPLLKRAPRHGRVLVNASRNALAPGMGAAAYSVSKMALTQLARVAALEWGGDGIRINIIHPDAVFDTGVWKEDVLKARAEHYGMTVEQYKRRNVLKTELSSHYVAELVAEMCGPLFENITGAQIPVDGGSDRVI